MELKNIEIPKKQPQKMVNFKLEAKKYQALKKKLKSQDIKVVDFFRAIVDTYLKGE